MSNGVRHGRRFYSQSFEGRIKGLTDRQLVPKSPEQVEARLMYGGREPKEYPEDGGCGSIELIVDVNNLPSPATLSPREGRLVSALIRLAAKAPDLDVA